MNKSNESVKMTKLNEVPIRKSHAQKSRFQRIKKREEQAKKCFVKTNTKKRLDANGFQY